MQDPIADASRAILDGHIVLSRTMAESGVYPAIDIEASISRSMLQITPKEQQADARLVKESFATYRANQIDFGRGLSSRHDAAIDRAIQSQGMIRNFINQPVSERVGIVDGINELRSSQAKCRLRRRLKPWVQRLPIK